MGSNDRHGAATETWGCCGGVDDSDVHGYQYFTEEEGKSLEKNLEFKAIDWGEFSEGPLIPEDLGLKQDIPAYTTTYGLYCNQNSIRLLAT